MTGEIPEQIPKKKSGDISGQILIGFPVGVFDEMSGEIFKVIPGYFFEGNPRRILKEILKWISGGIPESIPAGIPVRFNEGISKEFTVEIPEGI